MEKSLRIELEAGEVHAYPMLLAVVVEIAQHDDGDGKYRNHNVSVVVHGEILSSEPE
jgi:hypothetical protein